jgi:hypothetical protein
LVVPHAIYSWAWGAFESVCLLAYSPDLSPIERFWLLLNAEWFTDFIAKDREGLTLRLDQALGWVVVRAHDNVRTCAIKQ